MRTKDYEMVIAQHGNFTFVATQASETRQDGEPADELKQGEIDVKE